MFSSFSSLCLLLMTVINKVLKSIIVCKVHMYVCMCVCMLVCVLVRAYGGKRLVDSCVFFGHFSFYLRRLELSEPGAKDLTRLAGQ